MHCRRVFVRLLTLIFSFVLVSSNVNAVVGEKTCTLNKNYDSYIYAICRNYTISPELVRALVWHESGYLPYLVSSAGAVGLMQVVPYYNYGRMQRLNVYNLYDPYSNLVVGIDLLNEYYIKTKNEYIAVMAYAYGFKKAKQYWNSGYIPKEIHEIFSIKIKMKEMERSDGKKKRTCDNTESKRKANDSVSRKIS